MLLKFVSQHLSVRGTSSPSSLRVIMDSGILIPCVTVIGNFFLPCDYWKELLPIVAYCNYRLDNTFSFNLITMLECLTVWILFSSAHMKNLEFIERNLWPPKVNLITSVDSEMCVPCSVLSSISK